MAREPNRELADKTFANLQTGMSCLYPFGGSVTDMIFDLEIISSDYTACFMAVKAPLRVIDLVNLFRAFSGTLQKQ